MAGKIKHLLDKIIEARSKGNPTTTQTTKIKLILKGVDPISTMVRPKTTRIPFLKLKR